MRSAEGFDLDVSFQSLDDWGKREFSNLTESQLVRILEAVDRIASEGEERDAVVAAYRKVGGISRDNGIKAIKEYRNIVADRTGYRPGLLEAKRACIDNFDFKE